MKRDSDGESRVPGSEFRVVSPAGRRPARALRPTVPIALALGLLACACAQTEGPTPTAATRDSGPGTPSPGLYDPQIDPPAGPFSYLAKPSNLLAIVGQQGATQITWDGAFYTGAVELCIVAGDPPQPVAVRVKQLGLGHLPVVHYAWQSGDLRYSVTSFAAMVQAAGEAWPVNFIRLGIRRMATSKREGPPSPGVIGCAIRGSGGDHRAAALQTGGFDPNSRHEFGEGCLAVGGAAVCLLPDAAPARRYAVLDQPYTGPFAAENGTEGVSGDRADARSPDTPSVPFSAGDVFHVKHDTAALIALWDLGQAQEVQVDLKMPWRPVPLESVGVLQAIRGAGFDAFVQQLTYEWNAKLAEGTDLSFPEEKPLDTYAASLAYLLMSVERRPGALTRLVYRLRKEPLLPGESVRVIHALEVAGQLSLARECLTGLLDQQQADGCLSAGGDVRGHAQVLLAIGRHYALCRDENWGAQVYPKLQKAVAWLAEALVLGAAQRGARPANPGEQLAVATALASAGEMAAGLGHPDNSAQWLGRLEAVPLPSPADVPGLPSDALGGLADAAQNLSLAPRLSLAKGLEEAQVTGLCQRLHRSYAEGILAEGGVLSPLATIDLAWLHAARGEQEQALRDLYGILVHTGSCHEGFAVGARAWGDRDSGEDVTPDPVFAAAYAELVRDLLVSEEGDELHLFRLIAPGWVQPDKPTGVKNALTTFGVVSAVATMSSKGAEVEIAAQWRERPARIVLHVPWFAEVTRVSADQPGVAQKEGAPSAAYDTADVPSAAAGAPNRWVELSPDTTQLKIDWRLRKLDALTYDDALDAWREWYGKVYDKYLANGGRRTPLEPPPLR